MMKDTYLKWDDGEGNAIILNDTFAIKVYIKMAQEYLNGGKPNNFFEVKVNGGSFSGNKVSCSFDNPHNPMVISNNETYQHDGKLYRSGKSVCFVIGNFPIILNNPVYVELPTELIIPLPEVRKKDYLLRNGLTFIYVSYDKYMTDYDTHKFFIGPPHDMREVEITDIIRYRDGGTTIIKTKVGELYVPTPFKKGKSDYVIRFDENEYFECPEDLIVEETKSVARVTNLT